MSAPLKLFYSSITVLEAGLDEAGRGCLAGPVFAAAVILKPDIPAFLARHLNDSKKMSASNRTEFRHEIEKHSLSLGVGMADHQEIDRVNILNASFLAMHRAIKKLHPEPELLLVDGNRFAPFENIKHCCIIKGDGLYLSIAAASVMAKTYRDRFMQQIHRDYPFYAWEQNKGYPTRQHKEAIARYGLSPFHRKSFNSGWQLKLKV